MAQKMKLTILLVEDNHRDRARIIHYAQECRHLTITFKCVERIDDALDPAKSTAPDLILLSLNLPKSNGLDSVRLVCLANPQVPVVVLANTLSLEAGLESITFGAQDYLVKGKINTEIFERVIRYALERHQSKREIKDVNLKLQSILDALTSRIALLDTRKRVIWANKTTLTEVAKGGNDLSSLSCHDVLYKDQPFCEGCPVEVSFNTAEKQVKTVSSRSGRSFRVMAIPIQNDLGEIVNVVEVVEEITERLNLEQQLRKAQKMESLGTLAGGIAHDFNNILSAIMGFTELGLMQESIDATTRDYLTEVNNASIRATDLVRQILTFSRQVEQEPKPLMVQLVVSEALKLLRSTLPSSIDVQAHIDKNTRPVLADPTHIHQVVMNLGTNAMHAMEPEGGVLSIEVKEQEYSENSNASSDLEPEKCVIISVADTGCGIESGDIERVFDPYFTTKDIGEGTGLGLSVVQGIIEDCGGKISVTSIPEQGTTFTIVLPTVPPATIEQAEEQQSFLPCGSEHILVVDDEPFIRKLCDKILTKQGYRVSFAEDGRQALEMFTLHPDAYDLVLSDVMMPKLRGEVLAQQILEMKPDQIVMLMTGYAERLRKDDLLAIGIQGLLDKPIARKTLNFQVRAALDKSTPELLNKGFGTE